MSVKKRVFAYFDGSNFYHYLRANYGITNIRFLDITNQLLDLQKEELVKIKYFNSPVNQQENSIAYAAQQKFFESLKRTPLLELHLGKLVTRSLNKVRIKCKTCGHQHADSINCPKCRCAIPIESCQRTIEKGVDVQLAINMLIDAIGNRYDIALLFSGDADFCPAVTYICKQLNKEVIYCHFPSPKTGELLQKCSASRLITLDIVKKAQL